MCYRRRKKTHKLGKHHLEKLLFIRKKRSITLFYLNELPNQICPGHFCILPYHRVKYQPNLCNTQYSPLRSPRVFSETALKGKMSFRNHRVTIFLPRSSESIFVFSGGNVGDHIFMRERKINLKIGFKCI